MLLNVLQRLGQPPPRGMIPPEMPIEPGLRNPTVDGEPGAQADPLQVDSSGFSHLHPVLKLARSLSAEVLPYHAGAHGHTRVPNDVALGESGQGWGLTWAGCSPRGGVGVGRGLMYLP